MSDKILKDKVSTLIGKPIRVYENGDGLTDEYDDYVENRVNIEVSDDGTIKQIWCG